ncbi:hypothetical protein [Vulcanococcus limneticus]|jgi:hypothetical protein|uniref:hypothetical protein n=1 Tax=Vulcanococcus limneticus TaxID=2170428 RepID=UPI0034FD6176
MPEINIADSRKRDAVVKAVGLRLREPIRWLGPDGGYATTYRILRSTVDHDLDALESRFGEPEAIARALVEGDPEVDTERFGQSLWFLSRVFIDPAEKPVYQVQQNELVRDPRGQVIERRPLQRAEANTNGAIPLAWTGRRIAKAEAVRRYIFSDLLQIVHINGLTYDFLHGMASELAASDSLMLIGGGKGGRDPLVFRRGSLPYRGFLEGRVEGDRYALLLHLSNAELKRPNPPPQASSGGAAAADGAAAAGTGEAGAGIGEAGGVAP